MSEKIFHFYYIEQITVSSFDILITFPPVSALFQKHNCRPGPLALVSVQLQACIILQCGVYIGSSFPFQERYGIWHPS